MRVRKKLRGRLYLALLLLEIPAFLLLFIFMVNRYTQLASEEAFARAGKETEVFAQRFSHILNGVMGSVRMVSQLISGTDGDRVQRDLALFDSIAPKVVSLQPTFANIWVAMDYRYLDRNYRHIDGYRVILYRMMHGKPQRDTWVVDTSGVNTSPQYSEVRNANREMTVGPYEGRLDEGGVLHSLLTICAPIRDRTGAPAGLVSADLVLDEFQSLIKDMLPYEGCYSLLISDRMEVVAGPTRASVGLPVKDALSNIPDYQKLTERMRSGERLSLPFESTVTHDDYILFSYPIRVGDDQHFWSLCLVVPYESLLGGILVHNTLALVLLLISMLVVVVGGWQVVRRVFRPLEPIRANLEQLSYGRVDCVESLPVGGHDEFASLAQSVVRLRDDLEEKVRFANALGSGDYHATLAREEHDVLGKSLMEMQESLSRAEERDGQQREHEQQQRWVTQGIAKFSDIIRMERDNVGDFTYQFIHALARYTDSSIAALYLRKRASDALGEGMEALREEEIEYELSAAYAYQARKYEQAVFRKHQGLVGRCVAERRMVYLTELPNDYISIASGLGHSKPDALLVMPAFQEDELIGVLEIARFGHYQEYEMQFIQTVLNSLAATLDVFFSNLQTRKLLQEAQRQSVEMQEQREEMQQNIEEMQTLQEEIDRQRIENESLQRALQNSCCMVEYDPQGRLISANNAYLSLVRLPLSELLHTHFSEGLRFDDHNGGDYQRFWSDIIMGKVKRNVRARVRLGGGHELNMVETYSPIQDRHGNVVRVVKISFDVTPFLAGKSFHTIPSADGETASR